MMAEKRYETVGADHPISRLAIAFSSQAFEFAGIMEMSRWDLCVALANACGHILADSHDMPRDVALGRMDDLRRIMESAYDLRDVVGEG